MDRAQSFHVFEVAAGFCGIAWSDVGVSRFQLPTRSAAATERLRLRRLPDATPAPPPPAVAALAAAVGRYFRGEASDFSAVGLDLGDQTPAARAIYAAARRIGWGETTTYGALAKALGTGPLGAREVGEAMARNPVALIIPCHRVLAAGGKPGGFSAPGGTDTKLTMLELEGVSLRSPPPAQASFAF
jgi:methylated-DNA-[protein]-cysteine S-methyltransferase